MIFEADPQQVQELDSKALVELLHRLLLAESRLAEIPLRASHVALQITISDGGEDGRVEWVGGVDSTAYLPTRYSIFQSKAQNLTESSIRTEILKKAAKSKKANKKNAKAKSRRKATSNVLSEAIRSVLQKRGSYTIVSSAAFTGPKREKLKRAVEKAIKDGGGNLTRLTAVEVLDANKMAEWVNIHPSVALWLAKRSRRRSLAGFQTHQGWGKSAEIRASPWISGSPRFLPSNVSASGPVVRKNDDGSLSWHPDLDAFVAEFGSIPSVLDEVAVRLHPKSWWGSVVPHVELWMPLLEQWRTHPIAEVRAWADRKIDALTNYIAAQKKRDEESEVR